MDYKGPRCKNRKVILTLVWLLELQADIRSLHSYELAKYRPAEQGTLQTHTREGAQGNYMHIVCQHSWFNL